jgi:hypothetical protein
MDKRIKPRYYKPNLTNNQFNDNKSKNIKNDNDKIVKKNKMTKKIQIGGNNSPNIKTRLLYSKKQKLN